MLAQTAANCYTMLNVCCTTCIWYPCLAGPMLAHKAEEDGVAAVEIICHGSLELVVRLVSTIHVAHDNICYLAVLQAPCRPLGHTM
jgi:hypothetical protein